MSKPSPCVNDAVDDEHVALIDDAADVDTEVLPRLAKASQQAADLVTSPVEPFLRCARAGLVLPLDVVGHSGDRPIEVLGAEEAEGVLERGLESFLRVWVRLALHDVAFSQREDDAEGLVKSQNLVTAEIEATLALEGAQHRFDVPS